MPKTIWLTDQNSAAELQAKLDAQPEGASVDFAPRREYPGPVVLNQALVLEGGGATLWALVGPVLTVKAAVRVRNLRIEVTGDAPATDAAACAIIVAPGGHLTVENVEVRGLVRGLPREEGVWQYPHCLVLGGIAPGVAHHWRLALRVPVDCMIESHISGLRATPSELRAGVNDLQIHLDALPRDFLIDGHLLLSTAALRRRIAVTAYADESPGTLQGQGQVIWAPAVEPPPPTIEPTAPPERIAPIAPADAAPAPDTPSPEPAPVQPLARDRTPRLRRGQLPNGLFASPDVSGMSPDPQPAVIPHPKTVLGTIFQAGDRQPQSQDGPSTPSDLQEPPVEYDVDLTGNSADHAVQSTATGTPKTARKPQRGVPIQAIFGGSDNVGSKPIETPDKPVAPPLHPKLSEDRDATAKNRCRGASLPSNLGDLFKTPGS